MVKNNIKKVIQVVFLAFLSLLILVPVVYTDTRHNVVSSMDNTKLTELNLDNGINVENINKYFQERIGFRHLLIGVNGNINKTLFHEIEHPLYEYGNHGEVFFKSKEEHVDKDFIDAFTAYLKRIQDYCDDRNVGFIYCLNPSKSTVYSEKLPYGFKYTNENLAYIRSKLKENKVRYVDNVDVLIEESKKERTFQRLYDVGHWNDFGQMTATNTILKEVRKVFPNVKLLEKSNYNIKQTSMDYLPMSLIRIDEKVDVYNNDDVNRLDVTNDFKEIEKSRGYPFFKVWKLKEGNNLPKVLFFHGSYYNRNPDIYNSSFKETYAIHNYENLMNFDYFYGAFKPEFVIIESAEYTTNKNFFEYDWIKSKKLNPPLRYKLSLYEAKDSMLKAYFNEEEEKRKLQDLKNTTARVYTYKIPKTSYVKQAYLFDGKNEYDMKIDKDELTVTINLDNFDFDNAKIYLFE